MNLNISALFSVFVSRFRMRLAAFLLRGDYQHLQEFNAMDEEDFVDEYVFTAENTYDKR